MYFYITNKICSFTYSSI